MSKYWTHAAMLLLGVSLTVGFYEGRRLVRNTTRALAAMSQLGAASERRERAEESTAAVAEAPRPQRAGAGRAAGADPDTRRGARKQAVRNMDPARMDRIQALTEVRGRSRLQRIEPTRLGRGRPAGPLAMPHGPTADLALPRLEPELDGPPDPEVVDTGLQ